MTIIYYWILIIYYIFLVSRKIRYIVFAKFHLSSSQKSRFRTIPSSWGRLTWNLVGMNLGSKRRALLFFFLFRKFNGFYGGQGSNNTKTYTLSSCSLKAQSTETKHWLEIPFQKPYTPHRMNLWFELFSAVL